MGPRCGGGGGGVRGVRDLHGHRGSDRGREPRAHLQTPGGKGEQSWG